MTIVCDITGMTMTVTDEVSGDLPVAEPVPDDEAVEVESFFGRNPSDAPADDAKAAIGPVLAILIPLLQPLATAAVAALTKALTDWLSRIGQPAK